jgi:hypothetical protein
VVGAKLFAGTGQSTCDDCSRPIRWWERRVRIDGRRRIHHSCWQGKQFFRQLLAAHASEHAPVVLLEREPAPAYEVGIHDFDSNGLIVVWDFGWASFQGNFLRAVTESLNQAMPQPRMHQFAGVAIGLIG